jgi:hypothetical protein
VSQELLDVADVRAAFEHVRGARVPDQALPGRGGRIIEDARPPAITMPLGSIPGSTADPTRWPTRSRGTPRFACRRFASGGAGSAEGCPFYKTTGNPCLR